MTIHNDLQTLLAIVHDFEMTFKSTHVMDGAYRPASLIQPISRAQLGQGRNVEVVSNALGFDNETDPLLRMWESYQILAIFTDVHGNSTLF